jgi:hypothetical protein
LFTRRWRALEILLNERVRTAATAIGRAAQLQINRIPAIVFDGKAVVYGITDVDYAVQLYKTFGARADVRQPRVTSHRGIVDLHTGKNRK